MRIRLILMLVLTALCGCDLAVPNGLFGCGQPTDCPSGYFCWSSDSRCYDSKEPECAPRTCDEVISDFASLGIAIECGSLPDGCDGSVECGDCAAGEACGANGQNFLCGCEENTCANYAGGAECGEVLTRCGGDAQPIFCGDCVGDGFDCVDNKCVCPPGENCACADGQPTYPCVRNECSPPGGLPDGCGGFTNCPPCANGDDCVLSNDLRYECLGDCTCEAQGVECGNTTICGSPTLCGTCANNGFDGGYHCESGRCVCEDPFEDNDTFDTFALVCGPGTGLSCMQDAWGLDLQATLHGPQDIDYYALQVLDSTTPILAQTYGGKSSRVLKMTYLCPDGFEGLGQCSGREEEVKGIKFCVSETGMVGIERGCEKGATSAVGTVLVGVQARTFVGDCDGYSLNIYATFASELPVEF